MLQICGWADYLRDEAAKYRQLAEAAEELSIKQEPLLTFALREVERVISDQSRTNRRETINQLWDILDDPYLNNALGFPQNSRMTFRRSRF